LFLHTCSQSHFLIAGESSDEIFQKQIDYIRQQLEKQGNENVESEDEAEEEEEEVEGEGDYEYEEESFAASGGRAVGEEVLHALSLKRDSGFTSRSIGKEQLNVPEEMRSR
jgi:hypothetical protein